MGHLRNKYNADYFLSNKPDPETGQPYAVLGQAEFLAGETDARHHEEFEFCSKVASPFGSKSVLDIGCGRGDFISLFLREGVASYLALDFSPAALDIARRHFSDPRVQFLEMDAKCLCMKEAFDLILLCDVVEHIPAFEMDQIWPRLVEALRPGGRLVLTTPIFENPNEADHSDLTPVIAGMHCHKQTWGTLLHTAIQKGLIPIASADRMVGLARRDEVRQIPPSVANHLLAPFGLSTWPDLVTPELRQRLIPGAGRVAVGCVADSHPRFQIQALHLLHSLRWFGGGMAGANFFMCLVDSPDPHYVAEFERLGAFVRQVPRFSELHPHSNKIQFLHLPDLHAYDTMVLLDCDTLIVQDPWPWLDGTVFQAKFADVSTVPQSVFEKLFAHFKLSRPNRIYHCIPGGQSTFWYCNAGVLVIPGDLLEDVRERWDRWNRALLDHLELLREYSNYCEQVSLGLAFAESPWPFNPLPLEMNFPLHQTAYLQEPSMQACDPVVLHYHDRIEANGFLQEAPWPKAHTRVLQFNQRLLAERRRRFDNRSFWDFRYASFPELGSGSGSQGELARQKQQLLELWIRQYSPSSVLDIGCGDQRVSQILPNAIYTGVDLSSVIIEQNRNRFPGRKFICGDFLEVDLEPADFVVCLDLLIHFPEMGQYRAAVQRLIKLCRHTGLVSGFENRPPEVSNIVYFHEALSQTLIAAGALNLRRVNEYRDLTVWGFDVGPRLAGHPSGSSSTHNQKLAPWSLGSFWQTIKKYGGFDITD